MTTSDDEVSDNPKAFYVAQVELAKAHWNEKTKRAKKIHRKIERIRKDNLHKAGTSLTNNYPELVLGNLRLKACKAVLDAGFGTLKAF